MTKPRKWSDEDIAEMEDLLWQGATTADVARQFDCSPEAVRIQLRRYGSGRVSAS